MSLCMRTLLAADTDMLKLPDSTTTSDNEECSLCAFPPSPILGAVGPPFPHMGVFHNCIRRVGVNMNSLPLIPLPSTAPAAASDSIPNEQDQQERKIQKAVKSASENAMGFVILSSRAYLMNVLQDERVFKVVFLQNAEAFTHIPEEMRTNPKYCLEVLRSCPDVYKFVPKDDFMDERQFVVDFVDLAPRNFRYLEDIYKTDEQFCLDVTNKQPLVFEHLPPEIQQKCNFLLQLDKITPDVVKVLIRNSITCLHNNDTLATKASEDHPDNLYWLKGERLRNVDFVLNAVTKQPMSLKHVIFHNRTREVVLAAVQSNGLALEFAYEHNKSSFFFEEMIDAALTQNGLALKFVEEGHRTEDRVKLAITSNPLALQFAVNSTDNYVIVRKAIEANGHAIKYASTDLKENAELRYKATMSLVPDAESALWILQRMQMELLGVEDRTVMGFVKDVLYGIFNPKKATENIQINDVEKLEQYINISSAIASLFPVNEDAEDAEVRNLIHGAADIVAARAGGPTRALYKQEVRAGKRTLGKISTSATPVLLAKVLKDMHLNVQ